MSYNPILVDIWSAGVTLFSMVAGYLPFDEPTKNSLYKKITTCSYYCPDSFSPELCDLLSRIFVPDPSRRILMKEMLSHSWLADVKHPNSKGWQGENVSFDVECCKIVSKLMSIDLEIMQRMVQKNEHNRYITSYYIWLIVDII